MRAVEVPHSCAKSAHEWATPEFGGEFVSGPPARVKWAGCCGGPGLCGRSFDCTSCDETARGSAQDEKFVGVRRKARG
jgi:hypothetical protein